MRHGRRRCAAWRKTARTTKAAQGGMIIRDETGQTVEKMSAFLHGLQGQGIRPR